jgi:hypothetical protein
MQDAEDVWVRDEHDPVTDHDEVGPRFQARMLPSFRRGFQAKFEMWLPVRGERGRQRRAALWVDKMVANIFKTGIIPASF